MKPGAAQGFFGSDIVRRRFGDFELHLNRATVPSAAMQEHRHAEPHIVLALDSGYRSSARPSSHSAIAGEAIYNPPGTIHRDPADQIIIATARIRRCPLLTADARILRYPYVKLLT